MNLIGENSYPAAELQPIIKTLSRKAQYNNWTKKNGKKRKKMEKSEKK